MVKSVDSSMWISYMCLTELTILRVRSPSTPNVNPNFRQAIILRKDCQWTRLTTRLSKPGWRWETMIKHVCPDSPSPRLVSRSRSFPPNCNQAKKQRLLQCCMFISTKTSWDNGYQFFSSLLTCRSFKAKTEHILLKKNSQNKIDGKFWAR